ncbi:MAG: ketoacyl-ACP synthase III [Deltaproteobacteria bacterium]|nr:ketoacyl-ACP synthase III [Deltaproteobacteria bacterium]
MTTTPAFRSIVKGTGGFAPPYVVSNDDMGKIVETNDEWIVQRTGIKNRRLMKRQGEFSTADMANEASRQALQMAGLTALDLDLIIMGTVTPDYRCPSCAVVLQDKLGAKNAVAFDVSAACAGSLFALNIADKFIRTGSMRRILVVGGEAMSTITNWTDRNTCVLFGDAAGAFVLEAAPTHGAAAAPGLVDSRIWSDGSTWNFIYQPAGGSRAPLTPEDITAHKDRIVMNGREVYKVAVRTLVDASKTILADNGYTAADVKLVVAHQANLRIIEAVGERLGLGLDRFVINIDQYGNTSSASALVTFDEAVRAGRMQQGDLVLMLAIGAGMCWSSALYRVP